MVSDFFTCLVNNFDIFDLPSGLADTGRLVLKSCVLRVFRLRLKLPINEGQKPKQENATPFFIYL